MKRVLIILFLICYGTSFAGYETGNGGDVLVCLPDTPEAKEYETLDLFEGRYMRGITHNLLDLNLGVHEKILWVFTNLRRVDPDRADRYNDYYKSFYKESKFMSNITLEDIPDSSHIVIPKGCQIEQAVIQIKPKYEEDYRYYFDNDLWVKLDNDHKAALILHELVYREAINIYHQKHSKDVRYYVSMITSKKFPEVDLETYLNKLRLVGFKYSKKSKEIK